MSGKKNENTLMQQGKWFNAVKFVFSFVKPNRLAYWLGFLPYCSQDYTSTLLKAIFYNAITAGILRKDSISVLIAGIVYFFSYAVYLQIVVLGMRQYRKATEKSVYRLKLEVLRSFIRTDIEQQESTGVNIAVINTDVNTAAGILDQPFFFMAGCVFSIVSAFATMMFISWQLGLFAVLIGIVAYFTQLLFIKPIAELQKEYLSLNKKLSAVFADDLANQEVIYAYSRQNKTAEDFSKQSNPLHSLARKAGVIGSKQELFATPISFLTLTGILVLGGVLVSRGELTLPELIMLPSMCMLFTSSMTNLGKCWAALQGPIEAAKNLISIINTPVETLAEKIPVSNDDIPFVNDAFLAVSELSFTYKGSEEYALKHISFRVPPNALIMVVGRSGSGKSTLLKLIAGIYERQALPIQLGELQYANTPIEKWRSQSAYVDQSYTLFQMTVEENILLGNMNSGKETVIRAAKAAGAHEFIVKLENGYQTLCGEGGRKFSGGQQQRIALARALIRDVPLYILDEITASLDPETEQSIFQQIFNLRGKHTVLLSTHNLTYTPKADMILVMEGGELAQIGTHEMLMKQDGIYRDWHNKNELK